MDGLRLLLLALACALWPATAAAHRPIEAQEAPTSPERALPIDRPEVSQVYYARLHPEAPRVWMRFEGLAGQRVYFSLGVPVLDRLQTFRPRLVLVGPGLPEVDLPFALPTGAGGRVFECSAGRSFHEPFTGTDSWIRIEKTVTLPRTGRWFLVAYPPDGARPGDKLWISIGTVERFGLGDLLRFGRWRRDIRHFHEVKPPPRLKW